MDADNRKHEVEDIHRWLDHALQERMNAEPRNGLEERVLVRLASEPTQRLFAQWPMWAGAAAIVVIVVTLALLRPNRQEQVANGQQNATGLPNARTEATKITPNQRSNTERQVSSARDAAERNPHGAAIQPRIPAQAEPLPKLATFPAPRPETTQERLLARLAGQLNTIEIASISSDSVPLKELSIPELKVNPMNGTPPDDIQQEESGRKDASQERK